jgi:hypothetical protein
VLECDNVMNVLDAMNIVDQVLHREWLSHRDDSGPKKLVLGSKMRLRPSGMLAWLYVYW